jgi:predicted deacylase
VSRVSVSTLRPEPGSVRRGFVSVPGVEPAWELPVVVVRGAEPGPTLAITSGIHAAEYVPIEAVTQFSRRLDPTTLRGTVIAVLIVNTPGFYERTIYVNPRDGRNINRSFPGSLSGSPSECVAAFLTAEVVEGSDAYIDAHCGDLIEALMPFVLWTPVGQAAVDERAELMARAFGLDYMMAISPESIRGTASGTAAQRGIAAITAEVGQQGICDAGLVERYVAGLFRIIAQLGMVDATAGAGPGPTLLQEFAWLRADVSATFHPTVQVGDRVREGELVAHLRNVFGDPLSDVYANGTGVVVFCVTSLPVKAGDPMLGIGVLANLEARER